MEVIEERRCSWQQRRSCDKSVQCDLLGAPEDKESAERPETISKRHVMCDASCQTEYDMTDNVGSISPNLYDPYIVLL